MDRVTMPEEFAVEKVKFYFDPRCPWCFQSNRWVRRLEELGEIELSWGLYCLEVSNLAEGADPLPLGESARSATALRVAALMAREEGSTLPIGRFYKALGKRIWEAPMPAQDRDLAVRESAEEAGSDRGVLDRAMADPSTWDEVLRQHYALVQDKGCVGVPAVVLDGGDGPGIFGPVLALVPNDEDAVQLWRHSLALIRNGTFFEMKRKRTKIPDMPGGKVPMSQWTFGSRPWIAPVQQG
jgi:2-hydroxychromene-2-carboxylate isomerase